MEAVNHRQVHFEGSQPILCVEDMTASLRFYIEVLGFENAEWGTGLFTSVSRGMAAIYLYKGGQGRGGAWVWIGVGSAEKLHEQMQGPGMKIRMPLTNFSSALEFQIEYPDGNVVRLSSEPG